MFSGHSVTVFSTFAWKRDEWRNTHTVFKHTCCSTCVFIFHVAPPPSPQQEPIRCLQQQGSTSSLWLQTESSPFWHPTSNCHFLKQILWHHTCVWRCFLSSHNYKQSCTMNGNKMTLLRRKKRQDIDVTESNMWETEEENAMKEKAS